MKTQTINIIKQSNKLIQEAIQKSIDQLKWEKKQPSHIDRVKIWWVVYTFEGDYVTVKDKVYKNCTDIKEVYKWDWFIKYDNGSLYFGKIDNWKPSWYGTKFYKNWDIYDGNFNDGIISWEWKMRWKNGSSYDWNRESEKMNGKWTYINVNNLSFKWKWEDNRYMEDGMIRSKTDLDQYR